MKSLTIPFIKRLNELKQEELSQTLIDQGSSASIDQVNWKEFPYRPLTSFQTAHDGGRLYIQYQVHGNCLRAVNTRNNSPVWEDSCVEFFVKTQEDGTYYNFEFNCIGTALAAHRTSRTEKTDFDDAAIDSILRYPSINPRPFNELSGIFSWELIVSIPLRLIGLDGENLPKYIRGNFYKCADMTAQPHYVSWNPIPNPEPNFHLPEYFGELNFQTTEK